MNARLLMDTNVLIWTISASKKLSRRAKRILERPTSVVFVSVISAWEVVLKYQTGKLDLNAGIDGVLDTILYRSPWTVLPVRSEHLPEIAGLPTLHSDPFDRMLIAQAKYEGLTIVTPDEQFPRYGMPTLW